MSAPKLDHVRRVHIGGEVLQIRSDAPPETIELVAETVDNHLRRLQASGTEPDRFRLGILTALHVAGELFEARSQRDEAVVATDGALARLGEAVLEREALEATRDSQESEIATLRDELESLRSGPDSVVDSASREELDSALADRECALNELEEALRQRDEAQAARDAVVLERDTLKQELEGLRNRLGGILSRLEE